MSRRGKSETSFNKTLQGTRTSMGDFRASSSASPGLTICVSMKCFVWIYAVCLLGISSMNVEGSDMDSKYFIRNAQFLLLNERVVIIDSNSPTVVTMDEWPELIFLAADGQHTIAEFIASIGSEYDGGMPEGLPEQIRSIIQDLSEHGYITLLSSKKTLPYYFAIPVEEQDKEKAKALMEADGVIPKDRDR